MNIGKEKRITPIFLGVSGESVKEYGFSKIKKENVDLSKKIEMISYSESRENDFKNKGKGLHFFIDDYRFESVYRNPTKAQIRKLKQYEFVCSPDFSLYSDMSLWRQIESIGKSRWCGAMWQEEGIKVIPTVSWGLYNTFDFCFKGIEKGSIVAVGMIGAKRNNKRAFLRGYEKMLEEIEPEAIICYGEPFEEMKGNIIKIDYMKNKYSKKQ